MQQTTTRVEVKLFGLQSDAAGNRNLPVTIQPGQTTASDVLQQLLLQAPALSQSIGGSRLAVNHGLVTPDHILHDEQEIALIGMIGGG